MSSAHLHAGVILFEITFMLSINILKKYIYLHRLLFFQMKGMVLVDGCSCNQALSECEDWRTSYVI